MQSGGTAPSWFEQAVTRFMPAGGTAGQVLTKLTDADFNAEWQDSQGGKTADEALELLAEIGMISPLVGEDGIIITDKNDYILSL